MNILAVFWRELAIGGLLLVLWGAHNLYYSPTITNLELRLELTQKELDKLNDVFLEQSNKILENSENTKQIVERGFTELDESLRNITKEQEIQIRDLLAIDIPEECDDINEFLIEVVDQLRWEE
jgi:hypothetical protein